MSKFYNILNNANLGVLKVAGKPDHSIIYCKINEILIGMNATSSHTLKLPYNTGKSTNIQLSYIPEIRNFSQISFISSNSKIVRVEENEDAFFEKIGKSDILFNIEARNEFKRRAVLGLFSMLINKDNREFIVCRPSEIIEGKDGIPSRFYAELNSEFYKYSSDPSITFNQLISDLSGFIGTDIGEFFHFFDVKQSIGFFDLKEHEILTSKSFRDHVNIALEEMKLGNSFYLSGIISYQLGEIGEEMFEKICSPTK